MNRFLEQLQKLKSSIIFESRRKQEIRQSLEKFISQPENMSSARRAPLLQIAAWIMQPLSIALAAVVLIVAVGATTSYAAADSLPGDKLYPVKIHVNEAVRSALAFAPRAKVQAEIDRAESRLEEADQLVILNRFSEEAKREVSDNFERHARKIDERIGKLEGSGDSELALDFNSQFESVLRVHQQILADLHQQNGPTEKELQPLRDNVAERLNVITSKRVRLESNGDQGSSEQAAQTRLIRAEQALQEAKASGDDNGDAVKKLESLLVRAHDKNKSGDYKDSASLSNRAIQGARDVKTLARIRHRVHLDVRLGIGDDDDTDGHQAVQDDSPSKNGGPSINDK